MQNEVPSMSWDICLRTNQLLLPRKRQDKIAVMTPPEPIKQMEYLKETNSTLKVEYDLKHEKLKKESETKLSDKMEDMDKKDTEIDVLKQQLALTKQVLGQSILFYTQITIHLLIKIISLILTAIRTQ